MFNPDIFWGAFKRAGLLTEVRFHPDFGQEVVFQAGYKRPDELVLDGAVHTTEHNIEYPSRDVTLKRDDMVTIGNDRFKVLRTPQAKGDGSFTVAWLEQVRP